MLLILAFVILTMSCSVVANEPPGTQSYHLEANDTLQEIWRIDNIVVNNNSRRASIVVDSGVLVIRGNKKTNFIDDRTFGISSLDGKELWEIPRTSAGDIAVQDSILYSGVAGYGYLQAYEVTTGNFLWETRLGWTKGILEIYPFAESVFAYTASNEFYQLTQKGEVVDVIRNDHPIYVMVDGIIYMKDPLSLKAVDLMSGSDLWKIELNSSYTFSPIFSEENIFLFTNRKIPKIYSVDRQSGSIQWVKEYGVVLSNLAVTPRQVYFLGEEGRIIALDRISGEESFALQFYPAIDSSKNINDYFIAVDVENNILIVYLGDVEEIIAYKIKDE